jgi:asparagine synthase (glutamine-hydrolysing)
LDESADAVSYARELGVEHTIEHVTPEKALTMLDDVVASCGEPFADYSIFPTMLIAQLAHQHVNVMLSGDGGDELFWGYAGRFASALKGSPAFRPRPHWIRTLRRGVGRFLKTEKRHSNLRRDAVGDRYRAVHMRIAEEDLAEIFPELPEWPTGYRLFTYSGCEPTKIAQWLRWNEFVGHLTMVLLKVDRASMHHSLEVRVPLLDRQVIDVALRVDWNSCLDLQRRIGKMPLRAALARHVRHQTAIKRGFEAPMSAWLRGPLKGIFDEALIERKELLGMPLNRPALENYFQKHITQQHDYARGLWTLLSLALWEKRFHGLKAKIA